MRYLAVILILAGCSQTVQDAAPKTCDAVKVAYLGYSASGVGSAKDHATVQAAYDAVIPICADPSHITEAQLAIVAIQLALIAKTAGKKS